MVRTLKDSFLDNMQKRADLIQLARFMLYRYFGLRKAFVIKVQAAAFSLHQILLE